MELIYSLKSNFWFNCVFGFWISGLKFNPTHTLNRVSEGLRKDRGLNYGAGEHFATDLIPF
jgi:hypothetical protein